MIMYLGLDVGGTHTDAVLIDEGGILASSKIPTDRGNLVATIETSIENILRDAGKADVQWINLSTTLSTNAIVEGKTENVGMLVSSGPGVDPANYRSGEHFEIITGSIDHRGTEIRPLDEKEIKNAVKKFTKGGLKAFAAVSKFSTRNPSHEKRLGEAVGEISDFITLGHTLSGELNFPRRIHTAYYNSAVWRLYKSFAESVESGIRKRGLTAPINILKADGGTMPLALSKVIPVESILSGPAASIMGIVALRDIREDAIVLDIGGTTTDIAIFAAGAPIVDREGISLDTRHTLVRALKTRSIGIGGDSLIRVSGGKVTAGPDRKGPSMAEGGGEPTLIDALNFAEYARYAGVEASQKGIRDLAASGGMEPERLCEAAIDYAVSEIRREVEQMLSGINERPVYTIHELLEERKIVPTKLYCMGGPAKVFAPLLEKAFGLMSVVPGEHAIANAIGATLARTTMFVDLFADTEKGRMLIPGLDISKTVTSNYSLENARSDAREHLGGYLSQIGIDRGGEVEVVEASSFNMVEGFYTVGRNIRVRCQVKPGVLMRLPSA